MLSNGSAAAIESARLIRSLLPKPRVLAFEQQWAFGEHLYFGNDVEIREIEISHPIRPRAIRAAASGADVVGVYVRHIDDAGRRQLGELGFREIAHFKKRKSYECLVFARAPFAASADSSGRASERRSSEALPTRPAPTAPPAAERP